MYDFNDGLDKDIIEPVADAYLKIPDGGRKAIHNFFVNLTYPTQAADSSYSAPGASGSSTGPPAGWPELQTSRRANGSPWRGATSS